MRSITVPIIAASLITLIAQCSASLSGFYVDNGLDQTVMHRMLSPKDAEHVEHEILELLGLPDRPPRRKHGIHPSIRKSAPKFLLDVYKRLNDEANGIDSSTHSRSTRSTSDSDRDRNLITDTDKDAIEQSDWIMTFLNKSKILEENIFIC